MATPPAAPESGPSRRALLLARIAAALRLLAMVNPLSVLLVHAVFVDAVCPAPACLRIRTVSTAMAVAASAWDAAVAVSLACSLRAHAGMPPLASGATVCLGLVAADVARLGPGDARPGVRMPLVGMAVSFVVLGWNDCAWALWAWWWMRKHKMTAIDVYRRPTG